MFARIRRTPSSPPSAQSLGLGGGGDPHDDAAAQARASLDELRGALDRLDFLTAKMAGDAGGGNVDGGGKAGGGRGRSPRKAVAPAKKAEAAAAKEVVTPANKDEAPSNRDEADEMATADAVEEGNDAVAGAADGDDKKTATKIVAAGAGPSGDQAEEAESGDSSPDDKLPTPPPAKIERSPSAAAADVLASAHAEFLSVDRHDEGEVVELLRRIAELVVLSERRAGQLLAEAPSVSAGGSTSSDGDGQDEAEEEGGTKGEGKISNEDAALPYLALFELFCERNALANIVNIVTGVAFARDEDDDGECDNDDAGSADATNNSTPKRTTHRLPPLTIATQAVQSISILVQNVSRATSLYFLLSNNRVNDLIKLPLHLYRRAELTARHRRYNELYSRRRGRKPPPQNDVGQYPSAEMGELTTHFVSFLKSLAMRVNAETLQFFLSFPLHDRGGAGRAGATDDEGEETSNVVQQPPLSYLARRRVVEFPLYARALEFCAPEMDSFVRVTAMNVCMNIVRLATVGPDGEEEEEEGKGAEDRGANEEDCERNEVAEPSGNNDDDGDEGGDGAAVNGEGNADGEKDAEGAEAPSATETKRDGAAPENDDQPAPPPHRPREALPTATPSGILAEAPALPLQDRIAIAQYACHPVRVGELVAPLCARLTSQFGQVEGTVRALEELNGATVATASAKPAVVEKGRGKKTPPRSNDEERDRLRNSVRDLIANVQDELLLLDDLLKVGLISLNEQAIEMMLATFVYPMLLQPLLLPLHRFASSKRGSDSSSPRANGGASPQDEARVKRPVIVPQSPPPFSSKRSTVSTDDCPESGVSTSDDGGISTEGGDSCENDKAGDAVTNGDVATPVTDTIASAIASAATAATDEASNKPHSYSSRDMDLAPSKTALLGLSVIFHTVSNPTFRHLLLTALLHPLSPEASGGMVVSAPPRITLPKRITGGACSSDDFQLEIRMEGNQARASKESESFQSDVNVYTFGTEPDDREEGQEGESCGDDGSFANTCVFILAPALVDMLRNDMSCSETESSSTNTRPNPYRTILLSAIAGSDEMVSLQPLATAALHAAVSSVDTSVVQKIMLSSRCRNDHDANATAKPSSKLLLKLEALDAVKETLKFLCRGIVNVFVTYDGWWRVKFNMVAARTLMDIVSENHDYLVIVEEIVGSIRLQAAEFLMTLPSHLDNKTREADATPKRKNNTPDNQYLEAWLLDRFFFDQTDRYTNSVVEHVCYLKEQGEGDDSKEQYRYGLEVLSTISIPGTSSLLCENTHVVDNMAIAAEEAKQNTPFHCAASWALACLYLDAFYTKLTKLSATLEDEMRMDSSAEERPSRRRKLSFIATRVDAYDDDSVDEGFSLAHISSKFAIALLDEGDSSSSETSAKQGGGSPPEHGSAVGLVGKAAFPCVCEVSPAMSHLFTGRTCISNEGIEWQSLYLVVVGKWAVLAEPGHGGTGGEGRVITACRLACLAVKKDASSAVNNKTPARRLLLAHSSLDPRPPSLFAVDNTASVRGRGGPNLGPNGLRLTRSRMDLWFEDANAAGHACKVLSAKIAKARAKRGGRIKVALLAK